MAIERGRTFHAFDQLQAFREQIFDLTQFHTEQRAALLARDLYEVLAKIIRNPANDDPAFLEAWQAADRRFEPLQKLIYLDEANRGTPTAFAVRVCDLTVPEAGERVQELREILPSSTFAKFRAGVLEVLLRRFSRERQPLPEALGLIFSPAEIRVLREIGVRMDRLAELDIEKALREHVGLRAVVSDLVFRRGKGAACALRDIVEGAGGPESDLGRIIRRGIFDSLIWGRGPDSVLTFEGGAHTVDLVKAKKVVRYLKKTASWKLLSAEDQAFLDGCCHG